MTTLVLIDDNVRVRRRLQTLLAAAGYRVLLAPNALEGLSLLRVVAVDAILCALMLPGMPGVPCIHRIRRTPAWQTLPLDSHAYLDMDRRGGPHDGGHSAQPAPASRRSLAVARPAGTTTGAAQDPGGTHHGHKPN